MHSRITFIASAFAAFVLFTSVVSPSVESAAAETRPVHADEGSESDEFELADFRPDEADIVSQSETSNTWSVGNGINVTEIAYEPINVLDSEGGWTPVSTAVVRFRDGSLAAQDHPLHPEFAREADDDAVMRVSHGSNTLSFALRGSDPDSRAVRTTPPDGAKNSEVTYLGATAAGDDLVYQVLPGAVKETIRLSAPPAPGKAKWVWDIEAPNLRLVKSSLGDLKFLDSSSKVIFVVPAPRMWDSSNLAGIREAAESPVDTEIVEVSPGRWTLSLKASERWLNSSERVYPVLVDPTTSLGDTTVTSFKSDGAARTDAVHIGNSRDSNTDKFWRARVVYNYSAMYGKQVLDATLSAAYVAGTNLSKTGSVYTATGASYGAIGTSLGALTVSTSGSTAASNIALPQQLSDWINAKVAKPLFIRGAETAGSYTYKQLNTTLKIVWKAFPAVTGIASPAPLNGETATIPPVVSATVSNVGGTGTVVRYVLSESSDLERDRIFVSDWQAVGPTSIPSELLFPHTTYYWAAEVNDNNDWLFGTSVSRKSPTWTFTTGAEPPATTGSLNTQPIYEEGTANVTDVRPQIGALVSGGSANLTDLHVEVWTDEDPGTLVTGCTQWDVPANSYDSCVPTQLLDHSTTYKARTRASTSANPGSWSSWLSFSTGAAPAAIPSTLTDSAELTSAPLVSGILLDHAGQPADEDTQVLLIARPPALDDADALLGEIVQLRIVGTAETDSEGKFAIRVESQDSLAELADIDGNVSVTVEATVDGSTAQFTTDLAMRPETRTVDGIYAGAFINPDPDGSGIAPVVPISVVVRPLEIGAESEPGVIDNLGELIESDDDPASALELAAATFDAADLTPGESPVSGGGSVTPVYGAAAGPGVGDKWVTSDDGIHIRCTEQIQKRYNVRVTLGDFYDQNGANSKARFEYQRSAKTTLGLALKGPSKGARFVFAGTTTMNSSINASFVDPNKKGNVEFRTVMKYEKRKTHCWDYTGETSYNKSWYNVKPYDFVGGRHYENAGSTPSTQKTNCAYYPKGTPNFYINNRTATTNKTGVELGSVIGIDLTSKTNYSSKSKVVIDKFAAATWLCGTLGGPEALLTPVGKLVAWPATKY